MSHCEGALLDILMFPGLSQFSHSVKNKTDHMLTETRENEKE